MMQHLSCVIYPNISKKDITLPEAYSGVSKQIQVFASMADNLGSFTEEAVGASQNMFLKNI